MTADVSDVELVAAIEQAYRVGYPRLVRVAAALLGDRERGRDAVQEAFVRALRSRGDLHRIESLDGWLWRTLVNVCLVERRRPLMASGVPVVRVTNGRLDWCSRPASSEAIRGYR